MCNGMSSLPLISTMKSPPAARGVYRQTAFFAALICLYLCPSPLPSFQGKRFLQPSRAKLVQPSHSLPYRREWSSRSAPDFCAKMLANPAPHDSACQRNRTSMRCKDGRYTMLSQFKQDYYLYTRHFKHLKRRGVYLDVATNDPIGISNSYVFDQCLGWSGLCVEANPQYLADIHRYRSCALLPTCVSDVDNRAVMFSLHGGLSGVDSTNKNNDAFARGKETVPKLKQKCSTLGREMRRYNVTHVDYLSLDVEGHEMQVLKGFDWNFTIINVITVEASPAVAPPIEAFLSDKEYIRHTPDLDERSVRTRRLYEDVVFLHKNVVFGQPV